MSDSAEAPGGSSNESPPTPVAQNSPPAAESSTPRGEGQNSSPPGSSTSAPPPAPSSSSAPPPSSPPSPPPPPPQAPPNSNSSLPSPPSNSGSSPPSPPPPASNSPPSGSQSPPKPSPPSNSNSTPPPPQNSSSSSSPPPPVGSSPPPAPVQPSPPPSGTPPLSPPSQSLPAPPPSKVSGGPVPSPPAQTISPPLPVSPPVAVSSPDTPTNPTTSTESPPPPPAPQTSHRVPSLSPPSANSKTVTSSESSGSSGDSGTGSIVGITVAGVIIIALVALIFVVSRRRWRRAEVLVTQYRPPPNSFSVKSDGYYYGQQHTMGGSGRTDAFYGSLPQQSPHGYGSHPDSSVMGGSKSWFSYEEMTEITNGFSKQNILGEGGFGCVYKGWLPDGRVVAVKELKAGSGQGEREFRAEVEIISRVHHRHLVSLVGYCIAEHHRLLIYEFVPNKTLEHHLYGNGMPALDWAKRVKIALGAARGLAYLHEDCHPKIIHRDIKSANILLDDAFEAQVADFGLAKPNDTNTHVSTRVMGTFGYMAPEYASSGKLTDRSDVYSFGVVLLELVTGRKPVDPSQPLGDESLAEWARPLLNRALETGDFGEFVDPRLEKNYVDSEMFRMIEAAAACVRHSAPKRPRMVQVVRALDSEGERSDISNGVKFGQSTIYESGQYNQDIVRFRRIAFGSEESTDYDSYSGEYTSREVSHGPPSSWKIRDSSSEFPSGESETRAMNAHSGEQRSGEARGNYRGRRF